MTFCVYEVWDLISNEPFYVGKGRSAEERHQQHLKAMQRKKNGAAFHKKLRSLIESQSPYEFRVVYVTEVEAEALTEEIRLIAVYGRRDLGTGCLLNLTDGGQGVSGRVQTLEARKKISESRIGRPPPNLGKRYKLKSPRKSNPWTAAQRELFENRTPQQIEQTRQRASISHRGKRLSKERYREHSQRMTGSGNPNYGKVGYYAGKVGPWAGKSHPNKGRKKGPDGKLYHPRELLEKFDLG